MYHTVLNLAINSDRVKIWFMFKKNIKIDGKNLMSLGGRNKHLYSMKGWWKGSVKEKVTRVIDVCV